MPILTVIEAVCDRCSKKNIVARTEGIYHSTSSSAVYEALGYVSWQISPQILCYECKKENEVKKDAYEFVHIWQTSESAEEVAEKLDWPLKAVRARAEHYRRIGIELKRFGNGGEELDIRSLVEYAKSVENDQ